MCIITTCITMALQRWCSCMLTYSCYIHNWSFASSVIVSSLCGLFLVWVTKFSAAFRMSLSPGILSRRWGKHLGSHIYMYIYTCIYKERPIEWESERENWRHNSDGANACIYRCCIHCGVAPLRLESTMDSLNQSDLDTDSVWQLVGDTFGIWYEIR